MTDALLDNPVYTHSPQAEAELMVTKALISGASGHRDQAIEGFVDAFRLAGKVDDALYAALLMMNNNEPERARQLLDEARRRAPENLIRRIVWMERISAFEALRKGLPEKEPGGTEHG